MEIGPENLMMPLDEVRTRTEDALRRVALWERRDENPDRLSGGGRQRLAIACALAMGSPLIVLDEPTANLDPQGIDDVYAALTDVVAAGDRAILLVEHNLDAAMGFLTRTIVLDRAGRVAFDGPPAEIIRTHAVDLVAMGVWLPGATLAALRMQDAGAHFDQLPLTPDELAAALAAATSHHVSTRSAHSKAEERNDESTRSTPDDGSRSLSEERSDETKRSATPIITARGLTVRRHRTEILHGIDLDIAPGSLTAIVGTNGAGKTTLLQSLAGVVPPPKRQVTVDGIDPGSASPRELANRIGFVFQNPEHQFIAHTVFDELAHGLRLRHTPDAEITERVDAMLTRFGLEAKAEVHPFLLSGGEKRRLSVGTALITRPRVLALDEPTFGQDRARASELLALLHDLRDEGTTILIVTHDLQLVAEHASHTVVLADGRVHAADRTEALLRDETAFVEAGLRLPALQRVLAAAGRAIA